jgi:molybdopterin/thiamine biosynthesis adenylyltransferase/rhodanese-related sulfurtransferase
MPTFRDLLSSARSRIVEVSPAEAAERLKTPGAVALDVREADEFEQGALRGAVHIPRGFLEMQAAGRLPERHVPVIVYCAGGVRSALAADTLSQLGYTDVVSVAGGFNRWKDEGLPWDMPAVLNPDQRNRYQRHLLLPEVDVEGQVKLLRSKVLLLGAGGLGSPAALYLAAAGVGTLGIVDMDVVDASNLQRQILHNLDRVGERKVESARKAITALNPDVQVVTYDTRLGADNVLEVFSGYDLIVDGTDNFPTRYLVNDASLKLDIPVVHGSIFRFEGQVSVYLPHEGPCYRCQVPEPPPPELAPSCAEAGVLGVLCGIIGSLQAIEAIKVLLGIGEPLAGRLLAYDALEGTFRTFRLNRDPECPACSVPKEQLVIAEYDQLCLPHPIEAPATLEPVPA